MQMLCKGVSGSIFSNKASRVSQGEAHHSRCYIRGGVNCQISRIAFWNSPGVHPHNSASVSWSPQCMQDSEEGLSLQWIPLR